MITITMIMTMTMTMTMTITITITINNDLEMHRQVKTNDIISRRFGDFMTPLSRVQIRIKLTNASSRVTKSSERGLLTTMLDRAHRLSSSWSYFTEECERLKSFL